jgi:phosphate transport system permease protein
VLFSPSQPPYSCNGHNFQVTSASDFSVRAEGLSNFGILPEIVGTLYSSILGVAIGAFFAIAVAIFLTQDFLPPKLEVIVKNVVDPLDRSHH